MNAHLEHVDAMGKFLDLCLFDPTMLKFISRHYKNKTGLDDELAKKINKQLKLDNGISYKYFKNPKRRLNISYYYNEISYYFLTKKIKIFQIR